MNDAIGAYLTNGAIHTAFRPAVPVAFAQDQHVCWE
jgi:hypothetical protein